MSMDGKWWVGPVKLSEISQKKPELLFKTVKIGSLSSSLQLLYLLSDPFFADP